MKTAVKISGLLTVLMLMILILGAYLNQSVRKNEIYTGLKDATENSIKCVFLNPEIRTLMMNAHNAEGENKIALEQKLIDEIIKMFSEEFVTNIYSDGEISIKILNYDVDAGLYDFYVQESFRYPNGFDGQCDYRRTVICEEIDYNYN